MSLRIVPLTLEEGNAMVSKYHRHHPPVQGMRFAIGAVGADNSLVGAAICGRPVARMTDQRYVLEVTRLVSDGTYNVCSMLYAACARAGKAMGFHKIQTYILSEEIGTTLKATGWECEGYSTDHRNRQSWESRPNRKQGLSHYSNRKTRWAKILNPLPEETTVIFPEVETGQMKLEL